MFFKLMSDNLPTMTDNCAMMQITKKLTKVDEAYIKSTLHVTRKELIS